MKKKYISEHSLDYRSAIIQLPLVRDTPHGILYTPVDVVAICSDIKDLAVETFIVLVLDARNRLINRAMVAVGIVDSTLVHPREVFRNAIVLGGASIVLAHNHPSGDPSPSANDLKITNQLIKAGEIIGIAVIDHIIIGRKAGTNKGYLSLRENALCAFSGTL